MEEARETRYWCHMCSQMVNPVVEAEIKCPFCRSGFIEEMRGVQDSVPDNRAAVSFWAPILMGMLNNPGRRTRIQGTRPVEEDGEHQNDHGTENEARNVRGSDLDQQLDEILRRRRRHSAAILQLLQGIQAGLTLETRNDENNGDNVDRDRGREREPVVFINPFNQTIMVQGSYDLNSLPVGSLGDYFVGPGFDLLLQRLAENDPNRYGTPPAQKEAVEALPVVKIEETLQCSVCLDDFEIGTDAKEMPCKHRFHSECLLPWLELHSSCPVCRYQLPTDETKTGSDRSRRSNGEDGSSSYAGSGGHGNGNGDGYPLEGESGNENGRRFSFSWLSGLFSSLRDTNNSSSNSGSQSETGSRSD